MHGNSESDLLNDCYPDRPEVDAVFIREKQWQLTPQSVSGEVTPVTHVPFTIGRESDNSLSIRHSTVSGHHAVLLVEGQHLVLRDRNSTNGTLLNGCPLKNGSTLREGDILHFGSVMYTIGQQSNADQEPTTPSDILAEAVAHVQFDRLLNSSALRPYFQPVVRLEDGRCVGYEVLSRSTLCGLETPDKMFRVAAQHTSEAALSRVCRLEGLKAATGLSSSFTIFLNTHPAELPSPCTTLAWNELTESLGDLRQRFPEVPLVLEVHESATASLAFLTMLRDVLRDLNIKLAYDDFGAGQARLAELVEVSPDILKFDIAIIQGLAESQQRRNMVDGLVKVARDLGAVCLAEGVETVNDTEVCMELGFTLAQGYLFGRAEPAARWKSLEDPLP